MQNFLIRTGDSFLSGWTGTEPFWTGFVWEWSDDTAPVWERIPSMATHYEYEDADRVCQLLRGKGFPCYVTDPYGIEADVEVIERDGHRFSGEEIEEMFRNPAGQPE